MNDVFVAGGREGNLSEMVFFIGIDNTGACIFSPKALEPDTQLKNIPAVAVRRRFSDASILAGEGKIRPEAWLVGDEAEELRVAIDREDLKLEEGLITIFKAGESLKEELDLIRLRVGLMAAIRDAIAERLETRADVTTVFSLLSSENGSNKALGSPTEAPPFWFVYALRRFQWPGSVMMEFNDAPRTRVEGRPTSTFGYLVQMKAVLPWGRGLWVDYPRQVGSRSHDIHSASLKELHEQSIDDVLRVALRTPSKRFSLLAPQQSILPTVEHQAFVDVGLDRDTRETTSRKFDSHLFLHYKTHRQRPGTQVLRLSRSDVKERGRLIGWVSAEDAPISKDIPYTLIARIDLWGRFFVSIADPTGMLLPINLETPGDDISRTLALRVDHLLFPNTSDKCCMGQSILLADEGKKDGTNYNTGHDPIELLDQTSFNGRPALPIKDTDLTARQCFHISTQEFWTNEIARFSGYARGDGYKKVREMELSQQVKGSTVDLELPITACLLTPASYKRDDVLKEMVKDNLAVNYGSLLSEKSEKTETSETSETDETDETVKIKVSKRVSAALLAHVPDDMIQLRSELKNLCSELDRQNRDHVSDETQSEA